MACWVCALVLLCLLFTRPLLACPQGPLSHLPFFTVWNAPTERCSSRFGVDLDLSVFDIVHNLNETFRGDNITIFYSDQLGFYPHYTAEGVSVYGGVPQNSSLSHHLWKANLDLQNAIPDRSFQGLAIVDWENWRPVWARNWASKEVYWRGSRTLVKTKHPDWNPEKIEAEARKEFEDLARAFMEETLKLGEAERAGGFWGFYGFPCCYNYQYKKNITYTGECPELEMKRNDRLAWLWNTSTALYPDIYLEQELKGRSQDVLLYARHRVLESMRVGAMVSPVQPAVIPYSRIAFTYSIDFLSQEDLVHTIGESAALGAAGVVLWGDANYSKNKSTCQAVKNYLDTTLGRYVVNVTEAASFCSMTLCSSQGRCLRRNPNSTAYLHFNPDTWTIAHKNETTVGPSYVVQPRVMGSREGKSEFTEFKCQCFPGWEGKHCQKPITHKVQVWKGKGAL